MNESCSMRMISLHTYEGVMSHIWISNITRMNVSLHTYELVVSHVWMSHVTQMICCREFELPSSLHRALLWIYRALLWIYRALLWIYRALLWIYRALLWIHRVLLWIYRALLCQNTKTRTDPGHTYKRVVSRIWMSCVTPVNESCHTRDWVVSHTHVWLSRVTQLIERPLESEQS